MPEKKRRHPKSELPDPVAIADSVGAEKNDLSQVSEFDKVMRGLIYVTKAELDSRIQRERSSKRRK
jgi:hypothetical protein